MVYRFGVASLGQLCVSGEVAELQRADVVSQHSTLAVLHAVLSFWEEEPSIETRLTGYWPLHNFYVNLI